MVPIFISISLIIEEKENKLSTSNDIILHFLEVLRKYTLRSKFWNTYESLEKLYITKSKIYAYTSFEAFSKIKFVIKICKHLRIALLIIFYENNQKFFGEKRHLYFLLCVKQSVTHHIKITTSLFCFLVFLHCKFTLGFYFYYLTHSYKHCY